MIVTIEILALSGLIGLFTGLVFVAVLGGWK